jgi:putative transposase
MADARRVLVLWRYDDNNFRLHPSLGNRPPAEACRTLELLDGIAPGMFAAPETDDYQTQGLSL